jgi:hypothetical protein
MKLAAVLLVVCACGDNTRVTPETLATSGKDGDKVEVTGQVHTVTFDSVRSAARRELIATHRDSVEWVLEQEDEARMGAQPSFDEPDGPYRRTTDRYILIRSVKPAGVTFGEEGFNSNRLEPAWGLAVHLPDLAPGQEMPEVGSTIKVKGTFKRVTWNQRAVDLPIIDDATITILDGPPPLLAMGEACTLDQQCGARLICDRVTTKCGLPPREIYWADPWHDVNGACDADADCPLGQVCDPSYTIAATPPYGPHYLPTVDTGRHLCRLAPGATVASQCPRIYTTRDLVGGRFVAGKEVCVRATLFVAIQAEDGDTHAQMRVDEPIPYPEPDAAYNLFGATTENGPMYKDPALPGGAIADPKENQEVIAIGTYRFDPSHGWYEVHPVKAYLAPP